MQNKLKMSLNGINLLTKPSEGFRDKPYNDGAHNASLAWGHKLHNGPVTPDDWKKYGQGIGEDQGLVFLRSDIAWAENEVNRVVEVQLNQNQFDAIVDFTYNEGSGTLEKSSVLKHLNADDFESACESLLLYEYADHKIEDGLETRRKNEIALFNTPMQPVEVSTETVPA